MEIFFIEVIYQKHSLAIQNKRNFPNNQKTKLGPAKKTRK